MRGFSTQGTQGTQGRRAVAFFSLFFIHLGRKETEKDRTTPYLLTCSIMTPLQKRGEKKKRSVCVCVSLPIEMLGEHHHHHHLALVLSILFSLSADDSVYCECNNTQTNTQSTACFSYGCERWWSSLMMILMIMSRMTISWWLSSLRAVEYTLPSLHQSEQMHLTQKCRWKIQVEHVVLIKQTLLHQPTHIIHFDGGRHTLWEYK